MRNEIDNLDNLGRVYFIVKNYVIQKGYAYEIDWQEQVNIQDLTAQSFLREYSWVVLASGLSDKVVSKVFPKIKTILNNWIDLEYIDANYDMLQKTLLNVFNNKLKIKALLDTSLIVHFKGFDGVKSEIQNKGITYLKSFSFIGEVTCFHIAKNIGLAFAKPDRHLLRISNKIGFDSPHVLCKLISEYVAEKIQVVDLVLWRYATLDNNYEKKLIELKSTLNYTD